MPTIKWSALTSHGNILTTELNALANGAFSAAGPAYDNTANLDEWFWLELVTGGSITPTAGANIQVFLVPSLDGANYDDGASSTNPAFQHILATISLKTGAGTKRSMTAFPIQLPPCKFKFILKNGSGVALSATGNVLNLYSSNETL